MRNKLVVAKFGGTSAATKQTRVQIIDNISKLRDAGNNVVVVISAMGRSGAPYSTDTLLSLIREDSDKKTFDLLVSCGETIAACVLCDELQASGFKAEALTGPYAGIKTDGVYGSSRFTGMDTSIVFDLLKEGTIPVITGYQGAGPDGRVTTMGRGSSDLSAVEIGGYLKADAVLIYSDVEGIAKADPRLWSEAPYIEKIDYDDILALASWGFKVIHPGAVAAAQRSGVPVKALSTFKSGKGTDICRLDRPAQGFIGAAVLRNMSVGKEETSLSLGSGLFASPKGEKAVITILCRPLAELPSDLVPSGSVKTVSDGLVHIVVDDSSVKDVLCGICKYLEK